MYKARAILLVDSGYMNTNSVCVKYTIIIYTMLIRRIICSYKDIRFGVETRDSRLETLN